MNHGHEFFATLERHVHDLRDGFSGDVVLGGTETATDNDRVAACQRGAKGQNDAIVIVTDVLVEVTGNAVGGELLAEPLGVGVGNLSEQQLSSYCDDFNSHWTTNFLPPT